jgi:hypothetical protein
MSIRIDISLGEFIDKLTILEIKSSRLRDTTQRANVDRELDALRATWRNSGYREADVAEDIEKLRSINARLWETEDALRAKERVGEFDAEFISLARSVYRANDERSEIKRRINRQLRSGIIEEKSYAPY